MIAHDRGESGARVLPSREYIERVAPFLGPDSPVVSVPLSRGESSRDPTKGAQAGEGREARVSVYHLPEGSIVLKEWRPRAKLLRWYSAWILAREMRHYGLLDGVPGVPRFLGKVDASRFLIEHVAGKPLHRGLDRETLHAALDNLEAVIADLHARGFAHLDLRHKGNILVGDGGKVWVIDLGQGLDCSRGFLRRLIFPLLRRVDRSAVTKFRARYAPETLPAARRERLERAYATRRTSRLPQFGRQLLRMMSWGPSHRAPGKPSGRGPELS